MWRVRWREWIDNQGIDVLADGAASSSGLAIQQVCREALAATPGHHRRLCSATRWNGMGDLPVMVLA
jgi:hypothetical protein